MLSVVQRNSIIHTLLVGIWNGPYRLQNHLENSWTTTITKHTKILWPKHTKILWPNSHTPGHSYQKSEKLTENCTQFLVAFLFAVAKIWRPAKCPSMCERLQKPRYIRAMQYYSALRRKNSWCTSSSEESPGNKAEWQKSVSRVT